MGLISGQQTTASYRGNTGWTSISTMDLGGTNDYKGRLRFDTLSAGKPITSLELQIRRDSSGGTASLALYATSDVNLTGQNIASAAYLGTFSISGTVEFKYLTLNAAAMAIISQFTGTWYLLIDADIAIELRGSAASNSARFNGEYAEGTIYVNIGGTWKLGTLYVNISGVWYPAMPYVHVSGVWKQGIP